MKKPMFLNNGTVAACLAGGVSGLSAVAPAYIGSSVWWCSYAAAAAI